MSSLAGKYRRYLVLPLTHVGQAEEEQKQSTETPRTAVIDSIKNSARTAIQASHQVHYNPEGTIDSSGLTQPEYDRLINNTVLGISSGLFSQPKVAIFITNSMKFVDIIDLSETHIRFLTEQLNNYLEDTDQSESNFRVGLVIHTTETVHTCYLECAVVTDPEAENGTDDFGQPVAYPYTLAKILFGYVPMTNKYLQYKLEGYYPIQIVLSSLAVQFKRQGDGSLQYSVTATIHPQENKRATM